VKASAISHAVWRGGIVYVTIVALITALVVLIY
jgi:hypothetical protein